MLTVRMTMRAGHGALATRANDKPMARLVSDADGRSPDRGVVPDLLCCNIFVRGAGGGNRTRTVSLGMERCPPECTENRVRSAPE